MGKLTRGFNFDFQANYPFAYPYNLLYLQKIHQITFTPKDFSIVVKLIHKI